MLVLAGQQHSLLSLPIPFSLRPIVFGIKTVMIPSYFMFILSHAWAAYHLAADPTNPMTLARLCIALHGYVWVRVSIAVFHLMDILRDYEYSVAIFFAGFLMTPMRKCCCWCSSCSSENEDLSD